MPDFERVKMYYDNGWATNDQVAKYVEYNKITLEEYNLITGNIYTMA
jgi:uncharacterized XkdX family phage protein